MIQENEHAFFYPKDKKHNASKMKIIFSGFLGKSTNTFFRHITEDPAYLYQPGPPQTVDVVHCKIEEFDFWLLMPSEHLNLNLYRDVVVNLSRMAIFYFDLSNESDALESYTLCKEHIKMCRDRGIPQIRLVGFTPTTSPNAKALECFDKFKSEEGFRNNWLIIDATIRGQAELMMFVRQLILENEMIRSTLGVIPDTYDNEDMNTLTEETKIFLSGCIGESARDFINLFARDLTHPFEIEKNQGISLIQSIVSEHPFWLLVLAEHERFDSDINAFLKLGRSIIFYYDLGCENSAKSAYHTTKRHLNICRQLGLDKFLLIGFTNKNATNPNALSWFERFRNEENLLQNTLICNNSEAGIEKLRDFISPIILLRGAPIYRGREPLPIAVDTDSRADSDSDGNVRYSHIKVFFSGYIWHEARDAIKLLTNDSHLMKMTMPPTGVNPFLCQISDFKFLLFLMMEQEAYQPRNDRFLKMGGMVIFYYNLSSRNASQASYRITKNHIQNCRHFGIKPLCLIGCAHTNTIDPVALEWFEKFRAEEGLENHCLIFDSTELGKEKYLSFIHSLLLEQEHALLLEESPNLLISDEDDAEKPVKPGCLLQ